MNALAIIIRNEDSPLMLLKKAMLSRIMKKAWAIAKNEKMSFGKALKKAWKEDKMKVQKGKISKSQFQLF